MTLEPIRGDYFAALRIPLLEGRGFTEADRADGVPVAVVNRALARKFWPGQVAVGRRMAKPGAPATEVTVVGVVGDVKRVALDQEEEPVAYFPHVQVHWNDSLFLTVRTSGAPERLAPVLRETVWATDPAATVTGVAPLSELVSESAAAPRLRAIVLTALAAPALVLSLVGIYGILAFAVTRRRREMAVRLALGAERRRVLEQVIGRGLGLVAAGLVLGAAGAAVAARLLGTFLFEVRPGDPLTFAAVPALFLAAGVLACWVPARRAAAADPATVLREG